MKNLYLMRHGRPVHGHPMNGERPLTDVGGKQAAQMSAWLTKLIGRVDIVIVSPMVRALQTGETMAEGLGSYTASTAMLKPDSTPEETWKEIVRLAAASTDVLVVGHDPNLNGLLLWLIGMEYNPEHTGPLYVRFDHGAIAYLKMNDDDVNTPDAILQWLITPALVPSIEEADIVEAARELLKAAV